MFWETNSWCDEKQSKHNLVTFYHCYRRHCGSLGIFNTLKNIDFKFGIPIKEMSKTVSASPNNLWVSHHKWLAMMIGNQMNITMQLACLTTKPVRLTVMGILFGYKASYIIYHHSSESPQNPNKIYFLFSWKFLYGWNRDGALSEPMHLWRKYVHSVALSQCFFKTSYAITWGGYWQWS